MCGIVGFVGGEEAAPILLDGLSRLEYRGYDSAGVAKAKGRLRVLSDMIQGGAAIHGTLGVGHTRWATHGAPSDVNSHPQVSRSGRIAVATTKAYSTQLAVLDLLGLYLARRLGTITDGRYRAAAQELLLLPSKLERVLEQRETIRYYASRYFNHESIFFIGRNVDYALGLEGSLKLKEISYIHSEAYASGELKHGTISLIEDGTLVVAVAAYAKLFEKAMSNVVEVKSRGADVLALTTQEHREAMDRVADGVFTIPDTDELLLPSLGVAPLQLLAYYIALMRGCDIDKPRNLAKSVTVE